MKCPDCGSTSETHSVNSKVGVFYKCGKCGAFFDGFDCKDETPPPEKGR